jgi:hypothetical protein
LTVHTRKLDCQAALDAGRDPRWQASVIRSRVVALYEAEVGGEKLHEADVNDAAIFVGLFTTMAMSRREYTAAERELKRFFEHPDIAGVDWRTRVDFECRLGFCALGQGRENEALSRFRSLLALPDPDERWVAERSIRNALEGHPLGLCPILCGRGLASERLTAFVEELVSQIRGVSPRRRPFPPRTSRAKLRRHLRKSYPRPSSDPDPLEAHWKRVHEWIRTHPPARLPNE